MNSGSVNNFLAATLGNSGLRQTDSEAGSPVGAPGQVLSLGRPPGTCLPTAAPRAEKQERAHGCLPRCSLSGRKQIAGGPLRTCPSPHPRPARRRGMNCNRAIGQVGSNGGLAGEKGGLWLATECPRELVLIPGPCECYRTWERGLCR